VFKVALAVCAFSGAMSKAGDVDESLAAGES